MRFIKRFNQISIKDVPLVGGKNASLGSMIQELCGQGIDVPDGFAVTADAYWYFLKFNELLPDIKSLLNDLKADDQLEHLNRIGAKIRSLIEHGQMPQDLADEIKQAYNALSKQYHVKNVSVAVRSSATAEDLPTASFAGQQETFLNVSGIENVIECCKKSMASLFTDRAIIYREQKGFAHLKVALSVGIQKMVRADKASAGVLFTVDTETGFSDAIIINASWGLGESVVKGIVNPDEFWVFKETLKQNYKPIIKKKLGTKRRKIIFATGRNHTRQITATKREQRSFSLYDEEILELARYGMKIEAFYSKVRGSWSPQDIEWAKDGVDGKLYILQARPETVHASIVANQYKVYRLKGSQSSLADKLLLTGQSIGRQIASGKVHVARSIHSIKKFEKGDILVAPFTDPDWVPVMRLASAIVTDTGGRTSHAAIVSRELGVPAIVGTGKATTLLKSGQEITIDCSKGQTGFIYDGLVQFTKKEILPQTLRKPASQIMVNCANPDAAIELSFLPVDGVGLARTEFIFSEIIKIHPMAAVKPEVITDMRIKRKIHEIIDGYVNAQQYVIDCLAQGIGMIAAAFYPRPVIVRTSDFKSNEYRNLIAGNYYEPEEENPMLGLRGASRYYSPLYEPAFALECAAIKKAREIMGFKNIKVMVPFVRTLAEAKKIIALLAKHKLVRKSNGLEIYMMAELPSNALLIREFCAYFNGFSIGSNDLTQTTLGVDRDSTLLSALFDETDEAVVTLLDMLVHGAKKSGKPIGICGQAPSDYPALAHYLIKQGISSVSLNPDAVIPFLEGGKNGAYD
jgi:pyruvate,water dikinase